MELQMNINEDIEKLAKDIQRFYFSTSNENNEKKLITMIKAFVENIPSGGLLVKLNKANVSGQVCPTCGSKDLADWNVYYRCNECDTKC